MTHRKLVQGAVSGLVIAALGASPMLFGQTLVGAFNNPLQAAMMILGGTIAVLGTFMFGALLAREMKLL